MLRTIKTGAGEVGVMDKIYHRLCATRTLSMLKEMQYAMFSRWFFFYVAEWHLWKLQGLEPTPEDDKPLYQERSMEHRFGDETCLMIGDSLERARDEIKRVLIHTDVASQECVETNACAWLFEAPSAYPHGKWLRETLIKMDHVASQYEVNAEMIEDPSLYLMMFDLGPLEPAFGQIVQRLGKVLDLTEEQQYSFEAARDLLTQSVVLQKPQARIAQSQPSGAAASDSGNQAGALGRSGKGRGGRSAHHQEQ
jgi:hypothetical protein